jgi:hypothetical protein
MGSSVNKSFALALTLLLIATSLSIITVKSAFAEAPSTPVFTISTLSGSYSVPTTYSTNPYNGANITNPGYTVNYLNITITIQNSPTTQYYFLEYKGHYTSNWSAFYSNEFNATVSASSGSQTVIDIWGNNVTTESRDQITLHYLSYNIENLPFGSQIDFRLQAINGTSGSSYYGPIVVGEVSTFSGVQTVTVPTSYSPITSIQPSEIPTATNAVPELSILAVILLFVSILAVSVIVEYKNGCKKKTT